MHCCMISEQARAGVDTAIRLLDLRNNLVFQTAQEENRYGSNCR